MPSKHTQGSDSGEYRNEACRMVDTKPDRLLLTIRPMTEGNARDWVGACHEYDASNEVTEHFVECVQRFTDGESE